MVVDVRAERRVVGVQRLGWRRKVWEGGRGGNFVSVITRESLGGPTGGDDVFCFCFFFYPPTFGRASMKSAALAKTGDLDSRE